MNDILIAAGKEIRLSGVVKKEEICYCPFHGGTLVKQVEARLPNGIPFIVMEDRQGYHLAIGDWDDNYPPPLIDFEQIPERLLEALG